ncbi:MAG: hypothetical protein M3P18_10800 [Actinomycetota bacterium]|nr:hypothetical protein [Actinomycetota bacterium]
MRDLKELLQPLEDQEMPDRWSEIGRASPRPLPEPHRSRIGTFVLLVAVLAVVGLILATLKPLGRNEQTPGNASEPPTWLVDLAYRISYQSGDITPTSAQWVLSDARAVGPTGSSADPKVREYLVVLHGHFVENEASVPYGAAAPTGSVLTFAVQAETRRLTDLGVGDREVRVEGLQSFGLPPASHTYTDSRGWTVAVPPGWSVQRFDLTTSSDSPVVGAMLSNVRLPAPVGSSRTPPPQASGVGFPSGAVALVIATTVPNWGGQHVWQPPLSVGDMWKGSASAGTPYLEGLDFTGAGQLYMATIKVGAQASKVDQAAAASVLASLRFEGPASSAPITGEPGPTKSLPYQTSSPEAPPTGVIEAPSIPFPSSEVTVTNGWQGYVRGDFVQVYAGSDYGDTSDRGQGWVIVVTHITPDSTSGKTYDTPGKDGPVTIESTDSDVLTLKATDGTVFVFDVATDTYKS